MSINRDRFTERVKHRSKREELAEEYKPPVDELATSRVFKE